jgi:Zn-dependent alcohol dehydrogenase
LGASKGTVSLKRYDQRGTTFSPITNGKQFVPEMIKWYHEGKFPVDKFVKFFKVSVDVSMYPHVGITDSDYA